ncbi:glycerol-3-phosphate dehydrogenase/oxidase [Lacicoccus qingdaonensis]|uniref:Glycerol-3-phosphate dehydrogenase n=1 Tax=Lacicoccus qingdaonensis TaxID=576118 RepID=A0A1G9ECQ4_9BACL|nr:glycerol-3-phosphate dehydrogenase/oxidase [Salinicoccus qingdaonensis]SDK73821.1 homodimeric glycerol 3-phosphate dehydrogenase (quinone) [Salinicoccus qingdaonensis]
MLNMLTRKDQLEHMEKVDYDVVVIGGGITGAGVALDAAKRGMKVALVEMQDFAAGTSSRSTKLVHGGLRYLKQMQIGVVRSTGIERAVVYENGPHVTTPEWMLLPFHKGGSYGETMTSIGLKVYDALARVKKGERRQMLSVDDVINKEPLVKQDGLLGGGYYVEYKTDDARLTIEVMKKAVEFGADPVNYMKSTGFVYDKGQVVGIRAQDELGGREYQILGRRVINAAGPWVDEVREEDPASKDIKKHIVLSKGVHIVFDKSDFPLGQAIYFDTKDDGRMMFAIPRNGKTYVGTTDTFYDENIAKPIATQEDRDYLLKNVNYMFPDLNLADGDIESSWAGIRPLIQQPGKGPSELSRKDEIWVADSKLINIAGGKLTGYRHMAEDIVNRVAKELKKEYGLKFKDCDTENQVISGGDVGGSNHFEAFIEAEASKAESFGLTKEEGRTVAGKYGSNADEIFKLASAVDSDNEYNLPPVEYAKVIYSIQNEMTAKPTDYFVRRTGDLYFDVSLVEKYQDGVVALMQNTLGWSDETKYQMVEELELALKNALGEFVK